MPDFAIVSLQDAKLKTLSGRQRTYINEYAGYIQQLSPGEAGMLHVEGDEKLTTITRRLTVTAQMLGITLTIKRSGEDIYFWTEGEAEVQPKPRRSRRTRKAETATSDQPFVEARGGEQEETGDSSQLGQHLSDSV
jgi:hypothetical protein